MTSVCVFLVLVKTEKKLKRLGKLDFVIGA